MCTYLTSTASVAGVALKTDGDWFALSDAVVYFDHPQEAPVEHALCIDFRGSRGDEPTGAGAVPRIAVELDAASARHLAESILATLDSDEVRALA
jgi:hypothetical protein